MEGSVLEVRDMTWPRGMLPAALWKWERRCGRQHSSHNYTNECKMLSKGRKYRRYECMCRLQQIGQARKVLSKFQNKSSSLSLSLSLSLSVCLSVSLYIYLQYTFIRQKQKSHLLRVHHVLGCLR